MEIKNKQLLKWELKSKEIKRTPTINRISEIFQLDKQEWIKWNYLFYLIELHLSEFFLKENNSNIL